MSSPNGNRNFLVANYHWLALGVAVLALVGAVALFFLSGGEDASYGDLGSAGSANAAEEKVRPANLTDFERVAALIRKAPALGSVPAKGANFLASEARMFCEFCKAPMLADASACPACGKAPSKAAEIVHDSDNDGMPDDWESRYGLNPNDPADAELDKDGDAFTNLEEFLAKTDPTSASSHPDYLDSVTLELPLVETKLSFVFENAMKLPSGYRFFFKDPTAKNDYGKLGRQYNPLVGEEIGKTGYAPVSYTEKTKKVPIKTAKGEKEQYKTVDVSVATVERKSDKRRFELVKGDAKFVSVDVQAKLVYTRGERKEFNVVKGQVIDLSGSKYTVEDVNAVGKGAAVTLKAVVGSSKKVIQALEP